MNSMYKRGTAIAAAVVLSLGLAACGGGGGGNLTTENRDLKDDLAAAQAAQAAAETARDAALAAQAAAEAAQAAADAARMTAETERDAANAAAMQAEADRMAAVAAQMDAEAAQAAAEADRDAAIAARDQALTDLGVAQQTLTSTEADLAQAQQDLEDARSDNTVSAGRITELEGEVSTLTMARDEAQGEVTRLMGVVSDKDNEISGLEGQITTLTMERDKYKQMVADAEQAAEEQAERDRLAAEAKQAAKLYAGISVPTATDDNTADTATTTGTRFAGYVTTAGTPAGASVGDIVVGISNDDDVALSEDKDTAVADNHGWEGKRYTRTTMSATQGTYEAIVYSNVEDPEPGRMFGNAEPGTGPTRDFEYDLDADGALTAAEADGVGGTGSEWVETRVGGSSFDHSAGVKEFALPTNTVRVMIAGTYHGVSGTYSCTPAASSTCAAEVAANGFTLGGTADGTNEFTAAGGTWTFKPGNPNARVMDARDMAYASYGWWIHKAENDGAFIASAFHAVTGDVADAEGLNDLNGTATYQGGAAGKYALKSSTGGTNDSGHFTARATLEADFTDNDGANAITGTIDQFVGADGESRDWLVKLGGSSIGDTGAIGDLDNGTEWTIGGEAADDAGQWSGALRNNGTDGVPQVATGTFYSTYGADGRMVGAFGANKQ